MNDEVVEIGDQVPVGEEDAAVVSLKNHHWSWWDEESDNTDDSVDNAALICCWTHPALVKVQKKLFSA